MAHKNREKRAAKKVRDNAELRAFAQGDDGDDVGYARKSRSKRRGPHPAVIALIITVVVVAGGFFGLKMVYDGSIKPVDPSDTTQVSVTIPEGSSTAAIASILKDNGVIKNAYFFRIYCQRMGYDGQFKYGNYTFSKSMSVDDIAGVIMKGTLASTKRFTIPEGLTIKQVGQSLEEQGIITADAFNDEVQNGVFDYQFLADCPAGPERLEGFLYPETYEVYSDATAHDVVDKMLAQFDALFKPEYYDKAKEMNMSVLQVVTMASILEREALLQDERPVMAGVFYNRLAQGIPLGSDATIQYILGEQKDFLTYADTEIDSPYNTYMYTGLPPGPICNPRIESIEAALYPDNNDYIYFVLSDALDGTHKFSVDYNEFLKNKDAYYKAVDSQ